MDLRKSMDGLEEACNGRLLVTTADATFWNGPCGGTMTRGTFTIDSASNTYRLAELVLVEEDGIQFDHPYHPIDAD